MTQHEQVSQQTPQQVMTTMAATGTSQATLSTATSTVQATQGPVPVPHTQPVIGIIYFIRNNGVKHDKGSQKSFILLDQDAKFSEICWLMKLIHINNYLFSKILKI